MKTSRFYLLLFLSLPLGVKALTHSRFYQWSFQSGNLVANWSFENALDSWVEFPFGGALDTHLKAAGTEVSAAKSGSFVAKAQRTDGAATSPHLLSNNIPFNPNNPSYTLSFYYKTTGTFTTNGIRPAINWYVKGLFDSSTTGAYLTASSTWKFYSMNFAPLARANTLRISLAEFVSSSVGTLYFDDVVLDVDALSDVSAEDRRKTNFETVAFGDALGRIHQTQAKATSVGDQYLVGGIGFDNFARPETTFLATPYSTSTPVLISSLLSGAQTFYGSSGPFNAKGYPFSRANYSNEPGSRVLEASEPDSAWQFGKGHTVKQDHYYVQDSIAPANIENPSTLNAECKYRLDWSKNEDSSYTLTWTNRLGQVIRSAHNITRNASSATSWKWAATRYEYYPSGAVKKVYTPIDDSAGTSNFAEVSQFNALGQTLSSYSPDRNLRKFWYNRQGQLRYSQDEEQRAGHYFTYYDYDNMGRLISQGLDTILSAVNQDSMDLDSYHGSSKIEQIGYIYDDTTGFQSRTGLTLNETMGTWKQYLDIHYASGRLICKYNKNQDNTYSKFTAKDKFVADFFRYDVRGNLSTSWKYIGAVRDPLKRLQDIWYLYDSQDRLQHYTNYSAADEYSASSSQTYYYDYHGQVSQITGLSGKPLAGYTYANWGPIAKVALGGNASGDSTTDMEYFYHSHGGLREIRATGLGQRIFQQFLGYESKAFAASGNPGLVQPKFDGSISQQTYKYTSDLDSIKPVRTVNYGYDQLGRMQTAKAYQNTNAHPLDGGQNIVSGSLTMDTTSALSSALEYDLNGRILGQRSAGTSSTDSAKYVYRQNSYRLDKVLGKLSLGSTRDMSSSGSFVYDTNGALIWDKSKKMNVDYGWDGLPVSFSVDSAVAKGIFRCCIYDARGLPQYFKVSYPRTTLYNFYDADGNRVSRVEVESKPNLSFNFKLRSVNYVYMGPGMIKEWREEYNQVGKIKTTSATVSLFGQSSQIGRIRPDGKYDFVVKNHQGSTMATVDDRGGYANGRAQDYLAYGSNKDLKINTADPVTQKYQGKELELLTGLYAFGARWHDPELGMFMSPDPRGQFFNPYTFGPGNPINGLEYNGECWNPFDGDCWEDVGKGISDAGDLIYRKSGEAKDAVDQWAKGTPDDDNTFHSMYRAVFGGCGSSECGDQDGDGIDDSYNSGIGVSVSVSSGGKSWGSVNNGHGRPIIPIALTDPEKKREKEIQRDKAGGKAVFDYHVSHESRPGDNVFAGAGPLDGDYPLSFGPSAAYRRQMAIAYMIALGGFGPLLSGSGVFASEEAVGTKAFHFTTDEFAESITQTGLRPGSFATPTAGLKPLQASIELALNPAGGARNVMLEIDVQGLRVSGLEIPNVTRVSGQFGMPGGGYEMQFPYSIPAEFIKVIQY
ncbi:MAG: hypothetical protein JWO30_597 [Fibrobacteres bacterium]|nr:hypothetical protein [Fibrobacterota bacterium]